MASLTQATSLGSQSKSGKPWPRLTAFFSVAKADMTVKMVVPILGNLVSRCGVVILRGSHVEVGGVAIEGLHDEVAVEAVAQERSKVIHKVANVGATLERNTRHVFAKQL